MDPEDELAYRLGMTEQEFKDLRWMLKINEKLNKPKEEDESKRTEG